MPGFRRYLAAHCCTLSTSLLLSSSTSCTTTATLRFTNCRSLVTLIRFDRHTLLLCHSLLVSIMSALYVLSVLLLGASLAAAQGGGGSTTFYVPGNGRNYSIAQVSQFAPIAYYYPVEPYYPVSIAALTAASALFELDLALPDPYVPVQPQGQVTPAVIGQPQYSAVSDDNASGSYFLNVSSAAYAGTPLVNNQVDTSQVPMYFSVQTLTQGTVGDAANANVLVINFFFLYMFNGAQAIHYTILDDTRNAIAQNLADHQGDIETLQVVVDADMTRVLYVGGSAHGNTNFGSGQALLGQRPVVYVALDSHALYTGADLSFNPTDGYNDYTVLDGAVSAGDALTIDIVDLYGIGGAVWAPTVDSLYHIGIDDQGRPLNPADTWAAFNGRLGFNYQGDANTCQYIECIGSCGPYYTEANAAYQDFACDVVPQSDQTSNGPQSFGGKDTAPPTLADVGDLGLPAPGSQLIYSLPVETANGLLVSYTSANNLQGDVYHPNNMAQGLPAWHGEFSQVCTNAGGSCLYDSGEYGAQLGSGNDISIVYFNSLYVLAYTDRNGNAVGYATSTNPLTGWTDHNWIDTSNFDSYTLPAMAVYNDEIIMIGTYECDCYTFFGRCIYYQQEKAIWWATGSAVSGGVSWSFQGFLGSSWASSADVSLAVFDGLLYLFYRDQSGHAIGYGTYNGNAWTLGGFINTGSFVTQSNAAAAAFDSSLYLAWQDVNSTAYYYATYSGGGWSTPTYINQPVAAAYESSFNIFLYATASNLYALYQGGCPACNGNDYQMVWLSNSNPVNPAAGNQWSLRALHVGQAGGNQGSLVVLQ